MQNRERVRAVTCYYCGQRSEKTTLPLHSKGLCPRCFSTVYESHAYKNFDKALIYAISALILFIPSNLYPILTFELNSIEYTTTFFESALRLYDVGFGLLAIVVFLTAIIFPILLLFSIIVIILNRYHYIKLKDRRGLYKLYSFTRMSSFVEVFSIALVVAYVKLVDISTVHVHGSVYFFIACIICYLLAIKNLHITRIHILEQKIPNSLNVSLSLVLTGLILYIPANILPMMNISKFGNIKPDTIISGVIALMEKELYPIGIVVFFASVIIPLFKLIGMLFILLSIKYNFYRNKIMKLRLFKFIEVIGKWSVLDIYMIALLVALVQEESLAYVEPGPASIFFTLVVFITMLSTGTFDTKLIWNRYEQN